MQRLEVSGAVRPIYGSLGVKRLILIFLTLNWHISVALLDQYKRWLQSVNTIYSGRIGLHVSAELISDHNYADIRRVCILQLYRNTVVKYTPFLFL